MGAAVRTQKITCVKGLCLYNLPPSPARLNPSHVEIAYL